MCDLFVAWLKVKGIRKEYTRTRFVVVALLLLVVMTESTVRSRLTPSKSAAAAVGVGVDFGAGNANFDKDKRLLNAKLSDRRRKRRQERLRGTRVEQQRLRRRRSSLVPGGYPSSVQTFFYGLMVCTFIGVWIVGFLWVAQRQSQLHQEQQQSHTLLDKGKSHSIQGVANSRPMLRNKNKNLNLNTPILSKAVVEWDQKTLIDMRELNQKLPFDNPDGGVWTQGWNVQPQTVDKDHPLKIFVVPHSHCDPGWIKTFDEYFQRQTKKILTSVVTSLAKHPKRKFIWAEISYFEWWWKEQSETTKKLVKTLMSNKQFEFVTGGWVQPDEANTQLYAMEIQLQEGHDFIRAEFGPEYVPKFGWSIDPFGYSPTMAYLLKKYNFQAMLIQRVHYAIKKELALHQNLEFLWRQTWDNNGDYDIFTHVMPFYSYDVPHTCGPDPSVCCQFDFARLREIAPGHKTNADACPWHKYTQRIHDGNVKERAMLLLDQYQKKAQLYKTNIVIAPLGDDFRYQTSEEADAQFENYERIFEYLNENVEGVSIQFGTLSEYFNEVMASKNFRVPLLKGSFFTYSDREEDYWSGYFTSRIFDKALDRKLERVLYAASSLGGTKLELQPSRRALSLFQHHDGVTGTARAHVVTDYAQRIHKAIRQCQNVIIQKLLQKQHQQEQEASSLQACWRSDAPRGLSQNMCGGNDSSGGEVLVYNPLETEQACGDVIVPGRSHRVATLPCELPGSLPNTKAHIQFDPQTGLMIHPIKEEWMVWRVNRGGAYLFFPGTLANHKEINLQILQGGYIVETYGWKRTVVERNVTLPATGVDGEISFKTAIVIDFVYETNLQNPNEEWLVRFSSPVGIENKGVFHTDLNGYNFDTHHFRDDMPIQSQVFPMPTHASIEDENQRLTILSEHAQGTASLEEGAIDVWLDRRLVQDDSRGLGQGVMDNVPTRTRLRVVLETDGYDPKNPEFSITPLAKLMFKELNHPLEVFGSFDKETGNYLPNLGDDWEKSVYKYKVPPVYMVYNRVEYLKKAIDSLRNSDFPRNEVPIVISHDGHIEDMVNYVNSIKSEFHVVQLFHPYACSEHPDTFPGDDPKLNQYFKGDEYGHKREAKVTCCKHHFTWMMNEVFQSNDDMLKDADGFLFLEEDYIVAPTIYESIQNGFEYVDVQNQRDENYFFGMTFDITEGYAFSASGHDRPWIQHRFTTGPMAFQRNIFQKLKIASKEYCTFDDYNW